MKRFSIVFLLTVFLLQFTNAQQHIVTFYVKDKAELYELPDYVSVDFYKDNFVRAYVWGDNIEKFKASGYEFTEIKPQIPKVIEMATTVDEMANWDKYPTYDVYVQMMQDFVSDYPQICRLDTIGYTQQGRLLLALKITDYPDSAEAEPEFFYTSTMHGDEVTGYVLMLRLIDSLLSSYNSSADIKNLIDSFEIWINPLANPDGTYKGGNDDISGATRYLANGVDPNRDFTYIDGSNSAGEVETEAMKRFASEHHFVLSANFHGGAEVMNYPWDTWTTSENAHADDAWLYKLSKDYVDSARLISSNYMTSVTSSGVTEGGDWYAIEGGRQDYMTYWQHCREVTIEISNTKLLSSDQLPLYWDINKRSLLNYIKFAKYGFYGLVTDEDGNPLDAKIEIIGHDKDNSWVVTDPQVGDYYRPIEPGTYDVVYSADGFIPDTENVVISDWYVSVEKNVILKEQVTSLLTANNSFIWKMYPNPAKDFVVLSFENEEHRKIELYDVNGKKLKSIETNLKNVSMNVKDLSAGIYIIRVILHEKLETKKLLVH